MAITGLKKYFKEIVAPSATVTEINKINHVEFGEEFAESMAVGIFKKALSESLDRISIPSGVDNDEVKLTAHDTYAPYTKGLLTWLSTSMINRDHLYLRKISVSRNYFIFEQVAKPSDIYSNIESKTLKPDILELNFWNYYDGAVIKNLCTVVADLMESMSKGVNVSSTLLFKINKLSEMINSPAEADPIKQQVKQVNEGLLNRSGAAIDASSDVTYTTFDATPIKAAIDFVYSLIANVIGISKGTLFGEVETGLGSQEGGDAAKDNKGYKHLYYSVWFGVLYSLYNQKVEYCNPDDIEKTQKVFDLIETVDLISDEAKAEFIAANTQFKVSDITL